VADAVHRNGQPDESAAARLISRRGQQLAGRVAAVMGSPISYADPLTGEITEVPVPEHQVVVPDQDEATEPSTDEQDRPAEATPWADRPDRDRLQRGTGAAGGGRAVAGAGAASNWLALIANVVIALGLAPSVWLARRTRCGGGWRTAWWAASWSPGSPCCSPLCRRSTRPPVGDWAEHRIRPATPAMPGGDREAARVGDQFLR